MLLTEPNVVCVSGNAVHKAVNRKESKRDKDVDRTGSTEFTAVSDGGGEMDSALEFAVESDAEYSMSECVPVTGCFCCPFC